VEVQFAKRAATLKRKPAMRMKKKHIAVNLQWRTSIVQKRRIPVEQDANVIVASPSL